MKDYTFFVRANDTVAKGVHRLTLACWDDSFFKEAKPGQFLHIRMPRKTHLTLRRPISMYIVDDAAHTVSIVVAEKGDGTRALCTVETGTELSAVGPIGNGFPVDNYFSGDEVWLIGGGIGVAPLYFAAQALNARGVLVKAFFGWRDESMVFGVDDYKTVGCDVRLFTDDGSLGELGFAADALVEEASVKPPKAVFACGPMPMFRSLKYNLPRSVPCFVSLEERMGCGIGACLVCACGIRSSDGLVRKRVCVDGPVFSLWEVDFDG